MSRRKLVSELTSEEHQKRLKYNHDYYHNVAKHKLKFWESVRKQREHYKLAVGKFTPERRMYIHAKNRAKTKGIPFNITLDDISVPEYCPVLGIKLRRTPFKQKGISNRDSASLDRFDNSKGYIKGNVCVISNRANLLKNSATVEELELILKYMKNGLA